MTPKNQFDRDDVNRIVNEAAAAEFLGVSPRTLQNWRLRGGGPVFAKLGSGKQGRVGYRRRDLLEFVERSLAPHTSALRDPKRNSR